MKSILSAPSNLVDCLRARARRDPDRLAFTFLEDGERESGSLSYAELDLQARAMAALLQSEGLAGERVLLLLPPGLELVAALYGCLYAGVVAVTTAIPSRQAEGPLKRLLSIVEDCRPRAVLTTPQIGEAVRHRVSEMPGFERVSWLTQEQVEADRPWAEPELRSQSLAFLQYTSGSTASPRGVMVSHGNLSDNAEHLRLAMGHEEGKLGVSWLPLHHDMGLIGIVFQCVYAGMSTVLMSPLHFIQRPARWLWAISKYRAHTAGAPNFAYDLCARKAADEQCEGLDLSCWRVAFNGSEPVRPTTLRRFQERFAPYGLAPDALYPCYGLAECTLFVSGCDYRAEAVVKDFQASALREGRVVAASEGEECRTLVSSGRLRGQEAVIVDPATAKRCPSGEIGEIWLRGESVCLGYWELPDQSEAVFRAELAGEPEAGVFLRTGDLGFLEDEELFITGRHKDLIIVAGSNHYPQDIELTVENGLPDVRPGACAAISVDVDDEERLVVLAELREGRELSETARSIQRLVASEHDLRVHDVALVRPGSLAKTTSGKIQRHACRTAYLDEQLSRWELVTNEG